MWSKAIGRCGHAISGAMAFEATEARARSGVGNLGKRPKAIEAAAAATLSLVLAACVNIPANTGLPLEFESAERPAAANAFPNWPYPPEVIETSLLADLNAMNFEIVTDKRTAYGTSGARSVELKFPNAPGERKVIRFKWKDMPRKATTDATALEAQNDSPRRQIAAYQIQKFFLDPEDYVVPPAFAYCVSLALHDERRAGTSRPTLPDSNCVLGLVQVWLLDVGFDDSLYEETRFVSDPTYAYYLANFNLYTYLIDFGDPKWSNFLVSKDPDRQQIFAPDNDISFGELLRLPLVDGWNVIFVPALRRDSIERLRKLRREDLDQLGVVAQLEKDASGTYRSVPPGENLYPNEGVRVAGDTVQLGLARFEIEAVWKRMQTLLARVDSGEIPLF